MISKIFKKTISVFLVIIVFLSIALILFDSNTLIVHASTTSNDLFVGQNDSPNGETLYNLTNTFNYNGSNDKFDSTYDYYDTSSSSENTNIVLLLKAVFYS